MDPAKRLVVAAVVVLTLGLAWPNSGWTMGQLGSSDLNAGVIGKPAPDFTLETTDGQVKSFSQVRQGKKAILFFWATWCPHCHTALMRLNNSLEAVERRGVEIVLVDMGEARNEVKAYLQFNTVRMESFLDPDNSLQDPYQLVGVPTLYFIDEQGIIRSEQHEFRSDFETLFRPHGSN